MVSAALALPVLASAAAAAEALARSTAWAVKGVHQVTVGAAGLVSVVTVATATNRLAVAALRYFLAVLTQLVAAVLGRVGRPEMPMGGRDFPHRVEYLLLRLTPRCMC